MGNNGLTKSDNFGKIKLNGDGFKGLCKEILNEILDKIRKGETMNGNGNFSYQTPGAYRVFFMDLSSIVISALSQYDAKKKGQAAYPGQLVSHAQLISQDKQVHQAPAAVKSIAIKAYDINTAEKKISL
jgi:hypothetical protein